MNAESIAAALGPYTRKSGRGFMACCPAHDDKNPSMAIDEKDGKLLFKCFAGCDQADVIDALKSRDLLPGYTTSQAPIRASPAPIWTPILPVPADAPALPADHYRHGKPSMTWRYLSVDGELLQVVYRFDTGDGSKQVLPLTFCTNGTRQEWRWQTLPEPRPLYGLETIGTAEKVLIVEGEKTADAARRLLGPQIPVLTWSGGSNAVAKTDWSPLVGRTSAIWPDADEPGTKAALALIAELEALDSTVKVAEPPADVEAGWDLADAELEGWAGQRVREFLKDSLTAAEYTDNHRTAAPPEQPSEDAQKSESKRLKVVDVESFLKHKFSPRESILAPWLPAQGLAMVYAPRGIGKTHFSLGVAYAVASGGTFLQWTAGRPRGVLFIDGEMPGNVLQERISAIAISSDSEPVAPLRIITPDLQPDGGMLNLSSPEDQSLICPWLDGIDLIVVDNLSTLCRSGKEAEGESWLPVQQWALQQRAAGRSVLFIHHAGKNGEQRGTSRREDVLDTVIALKRPGDYTPDQGACFEVHFEKARGLYGDETKPFEAKLITDNDCHQIWSMKALEESTAEKVAKLIGDGVPQNEIAEMLGITKGAVSRAKKRAADAGLIAA